MGFFDFLTRQKVVVAYFVHTADGLGAHADSIIDISGEERWKEKLRSETGLSGAPVRLFDEDQWQMPEVKSHSDIYNQEVLTKILGGMAIALDELGVADPVVQKFIRGDIENIRLPTSGRVILFQVIDAPRSQLGRLLDNRERKQQKAGDSHTGVTDTNRATMHHIGEIDGKRMVMTPHRVILDYMNRIQQKTGKELAENDPGFWAVQWSAGLINMEPADALNKYRNDEIALEKLQSGTEIISDHQWDEPCWVVIFKTA